MMFLWLPLLFLIPFVLLRAARPDLGGGCCGMVHTEHARVTTRQPGSDPIEIARIRYARGELTTAEYEELRRLLG